MAQQAEGQSGQEGVLGTVAQLVTAADGDTLYRDVYLRRAAELLSPLVTEAHYESAMTSRGQLDRMLAQARALDPGGDYRQIPDGEFGGLEPTGFDLALCAFPFDNIPTLERKVRVLRGLAGLLAGDGRIVNLVSSPEIYLNEWASFTTRAYPENARARSGDTVRIVITDIPDPRPVEDILWTDEAYRDTYTRAGLDVMATYRPLGRDDEPVRWVNETRVAPWTIHVLGRGRGPA